MRHRTVSMLLVAVSMAGLARAQEERDAAAQPQQPRERTALRVDPSQAGENSLDKSIAACLILGNHEQVALAEFAQSRAQNEQVKEFAQMMIKDHQKAISQLEQFAPQQVSLKLEAQANEAGTRGRTRVARPEQDQAQPQEQATRRDPQFQGRTTTDQTVEAGGQQGDVMKQALKMQKEIAQQCLALTQRELSEHEGQKFDQAFVGQQIGAHIGMLAKLSGSDQFASAELQQVLQQQQETTQQHLQHAKQVMQELEGQSQTAERPTGERVER
ncbi:MAG: DUF4142 domain-containing protein [Pirellulales bacterium]